MLKKILQILVSMVLIIVIVVNIGVEKILSVFSQINILQLIPLFLIYLAMNILFSFRLRRLLKKLGHKLSISKVFFAHMFGMLLSEVTPAKSGYFSVSLSLKKLKVPVSRTLSCLGIIHIGDFFIKIVGSLLALIVLSTVLLNMTNYVFLGIGTAFVLIIIVSAFLWSDKVDKLFSPFRRFKIGEKIYQALPNIRKSSRILKKDLVFVVMISVVGWLFRGLEWYYLGSILNIELGFFIFLLLHPLLTLLNFVPITPAGIGIMEGGSVLLFTFFGVPPEVAFAFAILSRITNAFVDLVGVKDIFKF